MADISIIGAGSWGVGLAVLLYKNGHSITMWSAIPAEVDMLQKTREQKSMPGIKLAEEIRITGDMKEAVDGADLLVLAVPSVYTRETASRMSPYVHSGQKIVNVS